MAINNTNNNIESELNINQAALATNKSVHTIRKLLQKKLIKSSKINTNGRSEIRIKISELIAYYGQNNINKKVLMGYQLGINNTNNKLLMANDTLEKDAPKVNQDYLEKKIEDLEADKKNLQEELESRRSEAERMQKLLENQQLLSLGLQNQIKQLTDNQNLMLNSTIPRFESSDETSDMSGRHKNIPNSSVEVKSQEFPVKSEISPKKRKLWWQVWK